MEGRVTCKQPRPWVLSTTQVKLSKNEDLTKESETQGTSCPDLTVQQTVKAILVYTRRYSSSILVDTR